MSVELDNLVFDCVTKLVLASGGDGDGTIVVPDERVLEVAKRFEAWMAADPIFSGSPYQRFNNVDFVLFTDGSNENIIIVGDSKKEKVRPGWPVEVWIEVF